MMMTLSGREGRKRDSGDKSDLCLSDYNIDDNDEGMSEWMSGAV